MSGLTDAQKQQAAQLSKATAGPNATTEQLQRAYYDTQSAAAGLLKLGEVSKPSYTKSKNAGSKKRGKKAHSNRQKKSKKRVRSSRRRL
jgi:hypothetical protein